MALLFNSSIQPWLDLPNPFNITSSTLIPQLSPCVSIEGMNVSCAHVCSTGVQRNVSNYTSVFNPTTPVNLINCGIWRTASYSIALGGMLKDLWLRDENAERLRSVGFQFPDANFSAMVTEHIDWAYCFMALWNVVHANDPIMVAGNANGSSVVTSGDSDPVAPCEGRLIFLYDIVGAWYLPLCIQQLCHSTGLLDPDIGGVGVFSAFIIQTSFAILVSLALITAELWPQMQKSKHVVRQSQNSFKDKLVAANAEFYKAQCFLACAVQIACLLTAKRLDTYIRGLVEIGLFFTMATSGYVPVVFNLVCITRFGQSSWYFIVLASCCFLLSTATLAFSQWFWGPYMASVYDIFRHSGYVTHNTQSELGFFVDEATSLCGGYDSLALLKALCGNSIEITKGPALSIIQSGWNWLLWTICFFWLLYCILAKFLESNSSSDSGSSNNSYLMATCLRTILTVPGSRPRTKILWWSAFVLSWTIVVAYQFYIYSIFFANSQVNTTWSFGQIIAVTIWVPCLAEFILVFKVGIAKAYRYRLPKGFHIVRDQSCWLLNPSLEDSENHSQEAEKVSKENTTPLDDFRKEDNTSTAIESDPIVWPSGRKINPFFI